MTIKSLFFSLVLYISLVWVGAVYLYSGSVQKIREFGLFWTGAGLSAVLAFIIGARMLTWLRTFMARRAARPKLPPKPEPPVHEDEAALTALLAESREALTKIVPDTMQRSTAPFGGLPVYLLVGPEGTGKTSTFLHSGTDPVLLAGNAIGTSSAVPTRLANIWLARGAVFIELGGRLFSEDLARWTQVLRAFRGDVSRSTRRWRIWRKPPQPLNLYAVVAFLEIKNFVGGVNSDLLARDSHHWQERLSAIGEVFGAEFQVHQIVTKADEVTYFEEFFSRLPEGEAQQVFGSSLPFAASGDALRTELADAEARRLTRSFNGLYQALVERRNTHLAYEADRSRRPAIYEFPREFKRIRSALVEFLTDVYRLRPLRSGPVLAGYYLTATREVEAVPQDANTRSDWRAAEAAADATRLFRVDPTQMFRPDAVMRAGVARALTRRWMFTSELFREIVLQSGPARRRVAVDTRAETRRRLIAIGVSAACGVLCLVWIWSWAGNRAMLRSLVELPKVSARTRETLTLGDLRALEALRAEAARLTSWNREGPPLRLRWGMYAGNQVLDSVRNAYFRRFQALMLSDLNGVLVAELRGLPGNPAGDSPYDPVYRALATQLMISSGACRPDSALISGVLKQIADEKQPAPQGEVQTLIHRQLDYFAGELQYGNPVRIREDDEGRDNARRYLANVQGIDKIYSGILTTAEKDVGKTRKLADLAPNYALVLSGGTDVRPVFSRAGLQIVEKKSGDATSTSAGEPCVTGTQPQGGAASAQQPDVRMAIQRRFAKDYIEQWRKFLAAHSVTRYRGPEDAAEKLQTLSGHRSPLLALFALTADETDFPSQKPQDDSLLGKVPPGLGKILPGVVKAAKDAQKLAPPSGPRTPEGPEDIARAFQPVHAVVAPRSEKWVLEKNAAYVDALSALAASMREVARAGPTDVNVHQAAAQSYDKALDTARQVAREFKPVGVEGVDSVVQRLLEEPILHARPYITRDIAVAEKGRINGELSKLCLAARATLGRFPFHSRSEQDAGLAEMASIFAPAVGSVWKFQAAALSDLVAKDGGQWKVKDPAKKPQAAPELVAFLNRAQELTDAFYPGGAAQPQLTFTLLPKLDSAWKDWTLEMELNGSTQAFTSLRKQFSWPPPPAAREAGAVIRLRRSGVAVTAASGPGPWGIFRVMAESEPRALGSRTVEWKWMRVPGGRREPLTPPVQMEIVEFPGGADVFNPKFFEGMQCPTRAVQ